MPAVRIAGGGPAGASAALAALLAGADAEVFEKSAFPRHKVCGEFISPEILPVLRRLGVESSFFGARPAQIRRMSLHIGARTASTELPELAWGLSRYALDALLLKQASRAGALVRHEVAPGGVDIIATGRRGGVPRGGRLFGFKAHFDGPAEDAVELYFSHRCYVGLNAVENGGTNVCGLAPEEMLQSIRFEVDQLLSANAPLRERLSGLHRRMEWMFTGPLLFGASPDAGALLAGDALSFVDPFTGSGLLAAAVTGSVAGECAARGLSRAEYRQRCRTALARAYRFSSLLRRAVAVPGASALLPFVPGSVLYKLTRPAVG